MEITIQFRVICMDDANRPDGIPSSKWVKKGEYYTVIKVAKLLIQGGILGFKLKEINIDDCLPYQFFSAHRFGIPIEQKSYTLDEMLDELLKEAKEEFFFKQSHEN